MKYIFQIICLILLLNTNNLFSNTNESQKLLDSAKSIFQEINSFNRNELDSFKYDNLIDILETSIKLDSNNISAYYYLAYSYSRYNSPDGRSIIEMKENIVNKTSNLLEKLIDKKPDYHDDIILLDPYSKLTSEWGSLALSYLYKNNQDSAILAFNEGMKRGGFSKYILELNKLVLDNCTENSYLISSGDNFTFPLLYLQNVEKYRLDVKVIDIGLLNTLWYPRHLLKKDTNLFTLNHNDLDSIDYIFWKDSLVTIGDFSWIIKPTYLEKVLLRGDRLLLDILKQNKFNNDIYFTSFITEENRLFLEFYKELVFSIKILKEESVYNINDYLELYESALKLNKFANKNSIDQMRIVNGLRYELYQKIISYINAENIEYSKRILNLIDTYYNKEDYPLESEQFIEFDKMIRLLLD